MPRKVPYIYVIKKSLNPNSVYEGAVPIQQGGFLMSDMATISTGAYEFAKLSSSGDDKDFLRGQSPEGQMVMGIAGKPLYLPRAWRFKAKDNILYDIRDVSGSGNVIYVAFSGVRIAEGEPRAPADREVPKLISGKIVPLGIGASGTITLNTYENDFACLALVQRATDVFEVGKITDDATDKELTGGVLHGDALFGTAQDPRFLAGRRIYPANTIITIPVTNLSVAANNIYLGFLGVDLIGGEPIARD